MGLVLLIPLARLLPHTTRGAHPLGELFVRAGAPVAALALVAWMQDGNVIIVKHIASGRQAGSYAAAAVAAKAIMWVAVGLSLYRWRVVGVLAVAAIAQPVVLVVIGAHLTPIALGLLGVNGALGVTMVALALRAAPALPATEETEGEFEPVLTQVE